MPSSSNCLEPREARVESQVKPYPPAAPLRRLITLTTARQVNTQRALKPDLAAQGVVHKRWSYASLFAKPALPRAAWLFTDFDRLATADVELAGCYFDRLRAAGMPVLNDPRRFIGRVALIRLLKREAINTFTCWLPAEGEWPERYPVFLRTIAAHRGTESDLLHSRAEAEVALAHALDRGRVLMDLTFIEYRAEPTPEGVFRKHACFVVKGQAIRAVSVSEAWWMAKHGTVGAATEADYRADLAEHHAYPHADPMVRVAGLAGLDFCRIDYGIAGGRVEVYEVNSNPKIAWTDEHPSEKRMQADTVQRSALVGALAKLAVAPAGKPIDAADLASGRPAPAGSAEED